MSEGFDYGNARVRARAAALLDGDDYRRLVTLGLEGLLAALAETGYRADLEAAAPRHRGLRLLEEALRANLARSLRELAGWYRGEAAVQVALLVERWDVHNARTIIRGQHARSEPDRIRAALVPAGAMSDAVLADLVAQPGLRPAIDVMVAWGVPSREIARALAAALPELEGAGGIQALERALDRAAAERRRAALNQAAPEVAWVLRTEVDRVNLLTALRLFDAGPEAWDDLDSVERFLPGGALARELLARVVRADGRAGAAAVAGRGPLPSAWAPALSQWVESGDLVALADDLEGAVTREAAGMFATTDPLGVGPVVAFVWAKENEAKNLRTIGAGLAAGVPPDLIEEELVIL